MLSRGLGRTLYAFVVYLCAVCLPCGETLVPLLLESARSILRFPSPRPGG
jgi:hypothetical protein